MLAAVMAGGCGGEMVGPGDGEADVVTSLAVVTNPSGAAPLTARVTLTARQPVSVEVLVPGRDGPATDIRHRFEPAAERWELPILGLYPGSANEVVLQYTDAAGADLGRTTLSITTPPLSSDYPQIRIDAAVPGEMAPGVNLVSYFGHNGSLSPQRAFVFDAAGRVRWVFDATGHPTLSNLFYDNGIEVLANGNFYFGDRSTSTIYEIDRLGYTVREWPLAGYTFHHNVVEKPNGNFLVTVNKVGAATVEDRLIEVSRSSGAVVNEWDLTRSLQYGRRAWPTTRADLAVDWFHGNAVIYDPTDDTVIVSGRTQGLVKLTASNEVVWILAPHNGWATAGDGTDLTQRLLQPLDAAGRPISDPAVLAGDAAHPDFEWAWYQHAPLLLPDGTLLLFDNGENRQYTGAAVYSRAVGYRIDAGARTVQQVWQYGKERGRETFAPIVSDVDFLERERNVVFMPGSVQSGGASYGKVVEVGFDTRRVVFEATITPPVAPFGITFHRVERISMYPARPSTPAARVAGAGRATRTASRERR